MLESFELFRPSRVKDDGRNAKKHFAKWGWVNFLKGIAKTKVFDIAGSGMNSLDCVRKAPLVDVLIFAGEDKELSEAQYLDYEAKNKS